MSDKKPFYFIDDDTIEILMEALQLGHILARSQICSNARESIFETLAEVHERFNLPEVGVFNYEDEEDEDGVIIISKDDFVEDGSTIVPFHRIYGKPQFGVIKGGKDNDSSANDD